MMMFLIEEEADFIYLAGKQDKELQMSYEFYRLKERLLEMKKEYYVGID